MSDDPSRYILGIEEPVTPLLVGTLLGVGLAAMAAWMFARACPIVDCLIEVDPMHHF